MMGARQRLSDDHHSVDEVLKQLLAALDHRDVQTSYARLDLLWARLAVHIRAEHLHLFPAVTKHLREAQPMVEDLRTDHDFFMRELARAIAVLRELPASIVTASDEAKLDRVRKANARCKEVLDWEPFTIIKESFVVSNF